MTDERERHERILDRREAWQFNRSQMLDAMAEAAAQARKEAIAAMREPTEAMVKAGDDRHGDGFATSEDVYEAMIDAAILEDCHK